MTKKELRTKMRDILFPGYFEVPKSFRKDIPDRDINKLVKLFSTYLTERDARVIKRLKEEETIVPVLDSGNLSEYHEGFNEALDIAIKLIQEEGEV